MFSYDGWNSLNCKSRFQNQIFFFFIIYNELSDFVDSLDEFRKPEKKLIYSNSISVGIITFVCMYI
jgi:hypothetical protein